MELINEVYRHPDADPQARRFATATAASLVFPFAPHLGVGGLRDADRPARVGGAVADADPTCSRRTRSSSSARSTARSATGSMRRRGAPTDELERLCLESRGVQAHLDGHEIAKVIVVPTSWSTSSSASCGGWPDVQARLPDPRRRPRPDRRAAPAVARAGRIRERGGGHRAVRGRRGHPGRRGERPERDDVRARPPVHHRRRRRALEGQAVRRPRGRAGADPRRHHRGVLRARGQPRRRRRSACTTR